MDKGGNDYLLETTQLTKPNCKLPNIVEQGLDKLLSYS